MSVLYIVIELNWLVDMTMKYNNNDNDNDDNGSNNNDYDFKFHSLWLVDG